MTWVCTLLFNLDMGLGASICFALLTVIFRTQRLETYLFSSSALFYIMRIFNDLTFSFKTQILCFRASSWYRALFGYGNTQRGEAHSVRCNHGPRTVYFVFVKRKCMYHFWTAWMDSSVWQVKEIPGITIFRSSATLYFANAELYLEALKQKVSIGF